MSNFVDKYGEQPGITFGLENLKWKKPQIEERLDEMCKMLKIEEFKDRYPAELSGGQQQRVAIARTLAPAPKVLFMDELLSNLDAKLRTEMRTELKRLHVDTDCTFVYVTHDQLEAMTLATKVCLMNEGVMQQYDPPLVTYSRPENLFVADFVGNPAMNFVEVKAVQTDSRTVKLSAPGFESLLHTAAEVNLKGGDLILGMRPEFLTISDTGVPGRVYSTLPTGMETTVQISTAGQLYTCVVFGGVDYAVNQEVHFNFRGEDFLLFDKESGRRIADGTMELLA